LKTISFFFCTFILNSFSFFTNHNQCKKDLRKSGGSKEKDIHSYYAMVWASLAAKKQQQKLEIGKKGGVIFHYLIKTENSQGTFCQQRVLIKNASGRLGNVFTVITSKMYSSIYF